MLLTLGAVIFKLQLKYQVISNNKNINKTELIVKLVSMRHLF